MSDTERDVRDRWADASNEDLAAWLDEKGDEADDAGLRAVAAGSWEAARRLRQGTDREALINAFLDGHDFGWRDVPAVDALDGWDPRAALTGQEGEREVGCEDDEGLLHVHPESETCEVCAPDRPEREEAVEWDTLGGDGFSREEADAIREALEEVHPDRVHDLMVRVYEVSANASYAGAALARLRSTGEGAERVSDELLDQAIGAVAFMDKQSMGVKPWRWEKVLKHLKDVRDERRDALNRMEAQDA